MKFFLHSQCLININLVYSYTEHSGLIVLRSSALLKMTWVIYQLICQLAYSCSRLSLVSSGTSTVGGGKNLLVDFSPLGVLQPTRSYRNTFVHTWMANVTYLHHIHLLFGCSSHVVCEYLILYSEFQPYFQFIYNEKDGVYFYNTSIFI